MPLADRAEDSPGGAGRPVLLRELAALPREAVHMSSSDSAGPKPQGSGKMSSDSKESLSVFTSSSLRCSS